MQKEDIINKCLSHVRGGNYLEIGVRTGASITQIRAKRKWGVDPELQLSADPFKNYLKRNLALLVGIRFFDMTSDVFFDVHKSLLKKIKFMLPSLMVCIPMNNLYET